MATLPKGLEKQTIKYHIRYDIRKGVEKRVKLKSIIQKLPSDTMKVEVITSANKYVRPYFDIDIKKTDDSLTAEAYEALYNDKSDKVLLPVTEFLTEAFKIDKDSLAISESTYEDKSKISYHIIVHDKQILYQDLVKFKFANIEAFKRLYIDPAPYSKSGYQKFRMIGTSKTGMNAPLIPITHPEYYKHFVTVVEDSYDILTIDNTEPEKPADNPVKVDKHISNEPIMGDIDLICSKLNKKRWINYKDWLSLGFCLHNIDVNHFNIWDKYSKLYGKSKYKDGECKELWDNMKSNNYSIATLYYLLKKDNPKAHTKLVSSVLGPLITQAATGQDRELALLAAELLKDNWVYTGKEWYHFYNGVWTADKDADRIYDDLKILQKKLIEYQKELVTLCYSDETDDDQLEKYQKKISLISQNISKMSTIKFLKPVKTFLKGFLKDIEFTSKLNSNIYLLGFNDGILDLTTNQFRKAYPEDYVSMTCGHNYKDVMAVTDDESKWMNSIIKQIFVDKTEREYMINLLATCLNGNSPQQFQLNSGKARTGGNGKGLLKNIMLKALGDYGTSYNVSLIVQKRGQSTAANAELAKLKNVRYAVCSEPEKTDFLNTAIIKEMTGGDTINCRFLYSNDDHYKPHYTLFAECNDRPTPDSDDGGTLRRFRVFIFSSVFKPIDKYTKDDEVDKYTFKMDKSLDNNVTQKLLGRILLKKLIKRHHTLYKEKKHLDIPMTEQMIKNTKHYFDTQNPFLSWVDDNMTRASTYDGTIETPYTSMQSIWSAWEQSMEYKNLERKKRPKKRECIDFLIGHSTYGKYYHSKQNNKTKTRKHPVCKLYNILDDYVLNETFDNEPALWISELD